MLSIALDARSAYSPQRRAVGKCFAEVYHRAAGLCPEWLFVMLHRAGAAGDPFEGISNMRLRPIEIRGDRWGLWQKVPLPRAARAVPASGKPIAHHREETGQGYAYDLYAFERWVEFVALISRSGPRRGCMGSAARRVPLSDYSVGGFIHRIANAVRSACDV